VLARHPCLTAVIAHMGMPDYAAFLDLADRFERVHLDTTMAFTSPRPGCRLRTTCARGCSTWPSASCWAPTSRTRRTPYSHQIEALARLGLGDAWLRGVLHDNGARLIGLPTA
jgi:predicted TIM-barrel fold metal-dependent hydrolase